MPAAQTLCPECGSRIIRGYDRGRAKTVLLDMTARVFCTLDGSNEVVLTELSRVEHSYTCKPKEKPRGR